MPSRNDRGRDEPGTHEAGPHEAGPQEPLIDRQLELDVRRQHIVRVVKTRRGHVVLVLGESVSESRAAPRRPRQRRAIAG
jgi:hypothetical protein